MENRGYTGFCIVENAVCTPGSDGTGYCQCKSNYVEASPVGSDNVYCTEAPKTLSFEKRYQWEVNDVKTREPQTFNIEIKIDRKFRREDNSVDIVPRSNQISSTINDTSLTFTINSPNLLDDLQKYLVEVSTSFSGKHVIRDSFLLDLTLKSNTTNNTTMNGHVAENEAINTTVTSPPFLSGYKDFQFVDCSNAFRIEKDLYVKTKVKLDREVKDSYRCDIKGVLINNETSCVLRNVGTLVIEILDKNDERPVFTQQKYTGEIAENSPINTDVSFKIPIISEDKDISPNNDVTYTLGGNGSSLFKLQKVGNTREVRISSVAKLDRETQNSYSLIISAFDGNQTGIVELEILVLDVNEPPTFIQESYNFTVLEYSVGQFVGSVSATDNDSGKRGRVLYRLQKDFGLFRIDNNGSLHLINSIEKRDEECCELEIYATDDDNSTVKAVVKANVIIEDKNEPPQFNKPVYNFYVNENNESNATIGTVMATDNDFYDNAKLKYSILGNIGDLFHIATNSGDISCRKSFDYEKNQTFYFTVIVEDSGHPPLNSTAGVTVHVEDVNDNSPEPGKIFYKTTIPLRKGSYNVGKAITVIEATDDDSGQNGQIFYKIVEESNMDGLFNISKSSGLVTIAKNTTNYKSSYFLNISISDMGKPPRSTNIVLNVTVDEVSGVHSLRFNTTEIFITVQEEEKNPNDLWHIAEFVRNDENKDISFKFVGDGQSDYNVSIYKNGTLNNKQTFDREIKDLYPLIIQVYERNNTSVRDIVVVNIIVADINDNPPIFQLKKYYFQFNENVTDLFLLAVTANDIDIGNNSNIVYKFLNNIGVPFTINSTNGRITTDGVIDREVKDKYYLTVQASDGKHTVDVNVELDINDINDNSPQVNVVKVLNISENSSPDTKLTDITATDADENEKIRLSILNKTKNNCPFRLVSGGQDNAEIYATSMLDYETDNHSYVCIIKAIDQPSYDRHGYRRTTTVDITINVVDVNDNAPVFSNFTSIVTIEVDITIGTVITHLSASDKDSGSNAAITFSIDTENTKPYGYGTFFQIVNNSGISVGKSLSSIPSSTVELVLIAKDGGQPSLSSRSTMSINISRSEEIPKFTLSKYTLNIIEHEDYIPALTVTANDTKDGVNRQCNCTYNVLNNEYFSIDPSSGQLYLKNEKKVDREKTGSKFKIEVSAEDDDNPPRTATAEITIYVEDINDNHPVCDQSLFEFNVTQSNTTIFGTVVATDQDEGDNAKLDYHNKSPQGALFTVDITTGSLRLSKPFVTTSRIIQEYQFDVEVKDTLFATNCTVKVTVFPDNINTPNFTKATESTTPIPDTAPQLGDDCSNKLLGRCAGENSVCVTNQDGVGTCKCKETYVIVTVSGEKRCEEAPVRLFEQKYHFLSVNVNKAPVQSFSILMYIDPRYPIVYELVDLIPNKDFITASHGISSITLHINMQNTSITESEKFMVQVAATIDTVRILDSIFVELRLLGNNSFTQGSVEEEAINRRVNGSMYRDGYTDYEFDDNCEKVFIVDKITGEVTTNKALDREDKQEYNCRVKAKRIDEAIKKDLGDMKITVLDVNDNPPVFTDGYYLGFIEENSPKNTKVEFQVPITSTDNDVSPNNNVSYTKIKGSNKFQIQQVPGSREVEIWCSEELDREAEAWYYLSIEASDGVHTSTTGLNITVKDVNEPPQFTKIFYEFNVTEGERDIFVGDVSAIDSDADEKGDIIYSIKNGAFDSFHIENNGSLYFRGRQGNLTINRINRRYYDLTITATDREGSSSRADVVVRVTVLDQNEVPVFEKSSYSFSVLEGASCLNNIGVINATDNDEGMNAVLEYFLEGGGASMFQIGKDSGIITCKNKLDYENVTSRSTTFGVRVRDKGYPSLTATTTVTVKVEDDNDNSPTLSATYTTDVFDVDIKKIGKPIIVIDALDLDSGKNGETSFDIIYSSTVGLFNISSFGLVRVAANITTPPASQYNLSIKCSDLGIPSLNTITNLSISVKPFTTQTVSFDVIDLYFNLEEEQAYQNITIAIDSVKRFVINNNNLNIIFKLVGEPILGINMADNGTLMAYNKHFDREKRDLYEIITRVYDVTDFSNGDVAVITLKIVDINDHPPIFINNEAEAVVDIYENSDNNTHVITVPAIDLDTGNNSIIVYRILNPDVPFSVNRSSGRLVSSGTIDREHNGTVISQYTVTIEASDGKYNDNLTVTIFIKDRNDNSPQFHNISVNVSEKFAVNKTIITIDAIDLDDFKSGNGHVLFKLDDGQQACPISLSAGTHSDAEVLLSSTLDYEKTISHVCTIIAYDKPCKASESRSTTATFTINVLDENDNIPVFQNFINQTNIDIDVATGTVIIDSITASDDDSGSNGDVHFYIKDHPVKPFDKFSINNTTGRITAVGNYLAEDITIVHLVVIARDSGQPPLQTEATIHISIDSSDSRPIFKDNFQIYIVEHQEASVVNSKLPTIVAFDKKYGVEKRCLCTFNINSSKYQSLFSIGPISGVIELKKELDREVAGSKFNLMIEAIDDDQPKRTSTATVEVNVVDINDNPPTCNKNNIEFTINQSSPIGAVVGEIEAEDLDEGINAVLKYSLNKSNDYFDVDVTSGTVKRINSIVPSRMKRSFQMIVEVSDGKTTELCPISVQVLPDNTSPPKFTSDEYKATISINGKKGDNLKMTEEIKATDRDNDTITYRIDPSKIQNMVTVDSKSGIISLNADIDINTRYVTLVIMAIDGGTPRKTGSSSVVITVTGGLYVEQGKYDNIKRDAEKMTLFQILFIVILVALCIFIFFTVVACYKWRVSHRLSDSLRTRYYAGDNSKWGDLSSSHQYAGPTSTAGGFSNRSTGYSYQTEEPKPDYD